jgi:integrase
MSEETKPRRSRERGSGSIYKQKGSRFFWVAYFKDGKRVRESTECEQITDARLFLKRRLQAVDGGNFLGPRVEKITVNELFDDLLQDYKVHGYCFLWPERMWNANMKEYFGGETLTAEKRAEKYSGMRASRVGTTQIAAYVEKRQKEGISTSTINRELSMLRRAFSLAFDAEPQKVLRVPKFHKFIVSEKGCERRGFCEQEEYKKLAEHAKEPWLRGLLALAYTYGFRRGDLLGEWEEGRWKRMPMLCKQVDLLNNTVTLYSGETKNKEGRLVVLTEECKLLVTELRKGKQPDDFLFTRNGKPVKDFRGTWDALTESAGLPGLLVHDFRRSSARNAIRRGVPQKVARELGGWKTDSVFNRYNIVSEDDIKDAARKIEEGAQAVVHSLAIVTPETDSEKTEENVQKPV